MTKERWPLTEDERARLAPVIEEAEVSVCVTTGYLLLDASHISQTGWVEGWWPRSRRILLLEECFECASDEQLRGLLAREIGRSEGYHNLLGKCLGAALTVVFGALTLAAFWYSLTVWEFPLVWSGVGSVVLGGSVGAVVEEVVMNAFSRWAEYDACRRGARLLGETAPLEALYEPRVDAAYASWWHELICSTPHPADLIADLRALRDELADTDDER